MTKREEKEGGGRGCVFHSFSRLHCLWFVRVYTTSKNRNFLQGAGQIARRRWYTERGGKEGWKWARRKVVCPSVKRECR